MTNLDASLYFGRKSDWLDRWVLGTHLLTIGFGASAVLTGGASVVSYILAVLAGVSQFVAWVVRNSVSRHFTASRRLKRLALLEDGLGQTLDPAYARALRAEVVQLPETEATAYYTSDKPPGLARATENLHESAFFTASLLRRAARVAWLQFAVIVGVAFLVVVCGPLLYTDAEGVLLPHLFVTITVSAAVFERLERVLSWRQTITVAHTVDNILSSTESVDWCTLSVLLAEYAAATAVMPPIPERHHKERSPVLSALWKTRRREHSHSRHSRTTSSSTEDFPCDSSG